MSCPEVQFGPPFAARFYTETGDAERALSAARLVRDDVATLRGGGRTASMTPVATDLAQYALATHRAEEALALTASLPDAAGPAELRDVAGTRIEALVALRRWDELREFIDRVKALVDETPLLKPVIDRAQGIALAAEGQPGRAVDALRSSVAGFERLKFPFEVARTQEALADLVDPGEARTLREAALTTYEALGAVPHSARVRSALA